MRSVRVIIVLSLVAVCLSAVRAGTAAAAVRVWQPRLVSGVGGLAAPAGAEPATSAAYVPGQLLVEFRVGVSGAEQRSVARGAACVVSRRLPASAAAPGRALVLVSSSTQSTAELKREFLADPSVAGVSANYLRYVHAVPPDDPGLAQQWGLGDVRAGDAWQATTGSGDVVIADIDSGVDVLHPDLAANIWTNPGEVPGNGVDDDGNGYTDDVYGIDAAYGDSVPMDDHGHGTHTAGIAAAQGDNGAGIAGMGWHTRVMALKFITFWGGGTDAGAIECIDYAVSQKLKHGVNVVAINASWGGGSPNLFLRNAVQRAGDAGIVFVASAGNDASNNDLEPMYPASFDCSNILSVAATTSKGRLAEFSNYGRLSVDVAAPGEDILSCISDGGYERWSGTSMAAPFVAGAVALCAAQYPEETVEQRVERILDTARPDPAVAARVRSGGTLDAAAAVGLGGGGDGAPPVTAALGGGEPSYDVAVPIALFATDGPGGSGVASTAWRVDGGAWHAGTSVVVPAPKRTKRTRVLEYRSTDRAGNVEETRRLTIDVDTTVGSTAVPLPPSPVSGGVGGRNVDAFKLSLRSGETLTATSDGLSASSVVLVAYALKPRARLLGVWFPSRSRTFEFVAPYDGRYHVMVTQAGLWEGGAQLYRFSYLVVPQGTDAVPPVVALEGLKGTWHKAPVEARIVAQDGAGGSGVARLEQSNDDGLTWTEGERVFLDAPADHSNDGYHFVRVRAADAAGNVSATETRMIGIDTEGPVTQAWGPERAVRRGAHAMIRFRVDDLAPQVRDCRVVVRSTKTGKLVCVKRLGTRLAADTIWWAPDYRYGAVVTCRWAAGAYTVQVVATDPAGNRSETALCERLLVVK